ncbi:MAG: DUF1893 domain-containing protein [Candidatus Bathyarchaeota archaeon]|nr:DUF1893 domain-containing protein [Candidatus Bathyarchaeota archaeon]
MSQMNGLELAKQKLKEDKLSLAIAKDSHILYQTRSEGILGLLRAVDELKDELAGASVADRVMGKAAALLCVHVDVACVFALTMSKSGLTTLRKHGIYYEFEKLVPVILNMDKNCKCPLEKLVENLTNGEEAHQRIKQLVRP